jgi:exodeoxyribonuclease V alpha subunit
MFSSPIFDGRFEIPGGGMCESVGDNPNRRLMEWMPPPDASDFFFVEVKEPEERGESGRDRPRQNTKAVRPRPRSGRAGLLPHATGALGAHALNSDLQKALNPNMAEKIERFGSAFAPGDNVMQTENDYDREVFNGDLGRVPRIDQTEGVRIADFDGREVEYLCGELDALVPA